MREEEFLRAQLSQAEDALEATWRVKELAEAHYRQMLDSIRTIAFTLLAPEWNEMIREHPEANDWPPDRLIRWILETGRAKLNRLELLSMDRSPLLEAQSEELQRLRQEHRRLTGEQMELSEQLQQAQARVAVLEQQLQHLQTENFTLRQTVRQLQARDPASGPEVAVSSAVPEPEAEETSSHSASGWVEVATMEALGIIGSTGLALRESVARAMGRSSRSGAMATLFQHLKRQGLIAEEPAASEVAGRAPHIIRLTEKGRTAYRDRFGAEPVESEWDRLLRRHKSGEQAYLALQARQMLEDAGAEMVDLFPEPVPLPDSQRPFEVDLVAVLDGRKIFVECERATSHGERRLDKWSAYARVTRDFYFFVPNKEAQGRLMTELNLWAYRRPQDAAGVTVHICQLSSGKTIPLWHTARPLVGRP